MKNNIFFLTIFIIFSFNSFVVASENMINYALTVPLLPTNNIVSEEAIAINDAACKGVESADYGKALEIILLGIEKFPNDFSLQSFFASLLGDHSENFDGQLQYRMVMKSKEVFNKLMNEVESQSKSEIYSFKNEYFYRFGKYKEQYENGLATIADYEKTEDLLRQHGSSGYYRQGVGAANYAKQLLVAGNKMEALDYAQKAVVAWAQHFSYKNSYYNSYVHYGLALGILGYRQEMLNALSRGAFLIQQPLTYHEFKEIIDFFD